MAIDHLKIMSVFKFVIIYLRLRFLNSKLQ